MCVNHKNTCWSLFSDPLGKDCSLFPSSLISCPELSAFLFAAGFQQSFLWYLPSEKKLEGKGGLQGEVLFLLLPPGYCWAAGDDEPCTDGLVPAWSS